MPPAFAAPLEPPPVKLPKSDPSPPPTPELVVPLEVVPPEVLEVAIFGTNLSLLSLLSLLSELFSGEALASWWDMRAELSSSLAVRTRALGFEGVGAARANWER